VKLGLNKIICEKFLMHKKNKKGFTLIELLVVVAIMGLLSAVAVVALNQARARARDARRLSDIKQIQTALELFYLDQFEYPATPTAGEIGGDCLDEDGFNDVSCDANGTTYMGAVPENPQPRTDGNCSNTVYTYTAVDTGLKHLSYSIRYCLGSAVGEMTAGAHFATPAGLADP